jgi:DUF1680 family protein
LKKRYQNLHKASLLTAGLFLVASGITQDAKPEVFTTLPAGSIQPMGWLKQQMQQDLKGFVGNLDKIVPALINDPIYGKGRLQLHSKAKDLGNLKSGDAEGDEQYKWWNSETQSNWWDGYIRHVFLLKDKAGMQKVHAYVRRILATQDADGYLGIYDRDLRYRFNGENGELWSKASLYRGLLAYYEYTKDEKVFTAVKRAVDNVLQHYPIHQSSPFSSGTAFNGGVSHGLTFTDVLEKMYVYTKEQKYRDYAWFLYKDYSNTWQSETDAQLSSIQNPAYKLKAHGVHTYEHLRAVIIAAYAANQTQMDAALNTYLQRIQLATTISGGAIGDEWIGERRANATHTGYEYCSLHELLASYALLLQKNGSAAVGDQIENIFYNAAQGSRNPDNATIAYLKTDNSFEMLGTKNGEVEPDRKQTRYKYSPAHQDVAVCCNPNAGRITPYFIQHAWMLQGKNTLVATLLMPNSVTANINGQQVQITTQTNYPYAHQVSFTIQQSKAANFTLRIRKPSWAIAVKCKEVYTEQDGYIQISRRFAAKDLVEIAFDAKVLTRKDAEGDTYFTHGPLLYAKPINAKAIAGKTYTGNFTDYTYAPLEQTRYAAISGETPVYQENRIKTNLLNLQTGNKEAVELVPMGKTILRQVTFASKR